MRPPDLTILIWIIPVCIGGFIHYDNGVRSSAPVSGTGKSMIISTSPDTTSLCNLTFSLTNSQLSEASVDCRTLYNDCQAVLSQTQGGPTTTTPAPTTTTTASSQQTQSWTFYETLGGETYLIEGTITVTPSENNIDNLELCFVTTVNALHLSSSSKTCLTLPGPTTSVSSSAGISMFSSNPEGFVLAFKESSQTTQSSGATSAFSSNPEGFVFAFKESSPSTPSSNAEGFVFAFKESSATK